jgi:hypothetical protein
MNRKQGVLQHLPRVDLVLGRMGQAENPRHGLSGSISTLFEFIVFPINTIKFDLVGASGARCLRE